MHHVPSRCRRQEGKQRKAGKEKQRRRRAAWKRKGRAASWQRKMQNLENLEQRWRAAWKRSKQDGRKQNVGTVRRFIEEGAKRTRPGAAGAKGPWRWCASWGWTSKTARR